jgi:hypothetical protein
MKAFAAIGFLPAVVLVLASVACSSGAQSQPGERTGIAVVDAAIDAVLAGDAEALVEQTAFREEACARVEGLGGPPRCRPGEPNGTPVEVVRAATRSSRHTSASSAPDRSSTPSTATTG